MKHKSQLFPAVIPAFCAFIAVCWIFHTDPSTFIGAAFCHQISSRSPGYGFPFCYRCSGMFSGIFFGILSFYIFPENKKLLDKTRLTIFTAAFFIFLLDAVNSSSFIPISLYKESEIGRFLSAYPFGYSLSLIVIPVFLFIFDTEYIRPKPGPFKRFLFFSLTGFLSWLFIFSNNRILSGLFRIPVCAGSLFLLCILWMILCKCAASLTKKNRENKIYFSAGISLALLQVTVIGSAHFLLVRSGFIFQ